MIRWVWAESAADALHRCRLGVGWAAVDQARKWTPTNKWYRLWRVDGGVAALA